MNLQFNLNKVSVSVETYTPQIQLEIENAYLKSIIKKHGASLEGYAAVSMESGIWETIKNFFKRIKEWIFGPSEEESEKVKMKAQEVNANVGNLKENLTENFESGGEIDVVNKTSDGADKKMEELTKKWNSETKSSTDNVTKVKRRGAVVGANLSSHALYIGTSIKKSSAAFDKWDSTIRKELTSALNSIKNVTYSEYSAPEKVEMVPMDVMGIGLYVTHRIEDGRRKMDFEERRMEPSEIMFKIGVNFGLDLYIQTADKVKKLNSFITETLETLTKYVDDTLRELSSADIDEKETKRQQLLHSTLSCTIALIKRIKKLLLLYVTELDNIVSNVKSKTKPLYTKKKES